MTTSFEPNYDDPVLCYISGDCAFFTTLALEDQWGDDWNDAPYEHNAGSPYTGGVHDGHIECVYFQAALLTPDDGLLNSNYSVEDLNARKFPWLRPPGDMSLGPCIWAGTPESEFIRLIKLAGGVIYTRDSDG